ncbi:hypothetical protein BUALT_Bualt03G0000600 [Buddleja alternifolia]|uniref:non-specific serine/threonine protein kinase n=1 Tax=Buddleja alternifolia TaxID=168488 RepID=A0AAV6Y0Q0_9LAMI|nr:hypothetical protein BUALT_Bualt03G0000600 [Buddleja alternifolia]
MSSVGRLNLSFNRLQGKLDKRYARWPATAFDGNLNLCGSPLQSCKDIKSPSGESGLSESPVVIISAISTTIAIMLLLLGAALFFKHRREAFRRASELDSAYSSSSSQAQRRPLFENGRHDFRWIDIMEATNNLSEEFIVGSGGSGTIYRAELFSGETVAIKRIARKDDPFLDKSFAREIKTLGRIRHRHLVRLLGYCSNKRAGSNLLIYEYMENGSVWDWLYKQPFMNDNKKKILDWDARLKIAVGLAQGLEYLHHDCVPKILHRDVKSGNLLLDAKMEAHLGDFGLAKPLTDNHDSLNTDSNLWFAGSYGYIAPEYAYSLKATDKSDVYSMVIVLLELVSGRMPTDGRFGVDMDMVRWVESHMDMQTSHDLIDPLLQPLLPNEETAIFQVLEIALRCTKTAPAERPSSREASLLLVHLLNDTTLHSDKMSPDPYL